MADSPIEAVRTALRANGFEVDESMSSLGPFFVSLHRQGFSVARAQEQTAPAVTMDDLAKAYHILYGHIEPTRTDPCDRCRLWGRDLRAVLDRFARLREPVPSEEAQ